MDARSLCNGGSVAQGNCRHCQAILAGRLPLPHHLVSQELLPSGAWPVVHNGSGCSGIASVAVKDLGRLAFLIAFAGITKVVVFPGFHSEREYRGFVFQTHSGRTLVIVEADTTGNAIYLFDGSDEEAWLTAAMQTKLAILTTRPRCFLGRLWHRGNWQQRVRELVTA